MTGKVQDTTIDDLVTGQTVKIRTSPRYTVISVGPRDYFFSQPSGKYDGSGVNLNQETAPIPA